MSIINDVMQRIKVKYINFLLLISPIRQMTSKEAPHNPYLAIPFMDSPEARYCIKFRNKFVTYIDGIIKKPIQFNKTLSFAKTIESPAEI